MVMKRIFVCLALVLFVSPGFVLAYGTKEFDVDSSLLKMVVRENESIIKILNVDSRVDGDFSVTADGLDFLSVEDFFSLSAGGDKILRLEFNSSGMEPGIYSGELVISNGESVAIPVIFEIESEEVLFDGSIGVPLEYGKVYPGGRLVVENKIFNLENIGLKNIDVHYFVEDFHGNSLFSEDENLAVESRALNIKTVALPESIVPGYYLFGAVLKYGDSVGVSSYFFRVSVKEEVVAQKIDKENYFLWVVVVLLIMLVFFIIYYLRQRDQVFLELNKQYRAEVRREKCGKVRPKVKQRRLTVVKKIYKNRIRAVKALRRHNRKNDVDEKLAEWKRQGYNVDEFLTRRVKDEGSLKDRVKKHRKQGYKL